MGVTSKPPKPALAAFSISRVRLALSTALPGHHQRVQGLLVTVTAGQATVAEAAKAAESAGAEPDGFLADAIGMAITPSIPTTTDKIVATGRRGQRDCMAWFSLNARWSERWSPYQTPPPGDLQRRNDGTE
jgi:hypothetical protein